jgi:hypothetical protein
MQLSVAFYLFVDLLLCFCFESPKLTVIPVHQLMQQPVLCVFGDRMVNMGVWLPLVSELNQHFFFVVGHVTGKSDNLKDKHSGYFVFIFTSTTLIAMNNVCFRCDVCEPKGSVLKYGG